MRLGLPAPAGHHDCTPGPIQDPLGLHRLGCRNAAPARTLRHDEMVTVIAKSALNADPLSFQVAREERFVDADDSLERPGDVALNLGDGRTLADLTVASPFGAASQFSTRIARSPAAAASDAYDRKLLKWRRLLEDHELTDHSLLYNYSTACRDGPWGMGRKISSVVKEVLGRLCSISWDWQWRRIRRPHDPPVCRFMARKLALAQGSSRARWLGRLTSIWHLFIY